MASFEDVDSTAKAGRRVSAECSDEEPFLNSLVVYG